MSPPMDTTKIVYLTQEQITHINSLVSMRLTELTIASENPSIINMYLDIKRQLEKRL
jgi:hypothetical protein